MVRDSLWRFFAGLAGCYGRRDYKREGARKAVPRIKPIGTRIGEDAQGDTDRRSGEEQ
jgi:hypothetical protein